MSPGTPGQAAKASELWCPEPDGRNFYSFCEPRDRTVSLWHPPRSAGPGRPSMLVTRAETARHRVGRRLPCRAQANPAVKAASGRRLEEPVGSSQRWTLNKSSPSRYTQRPSMKCQ
jgi:hypothetical protein